MKTRTAAATNKSAVKPLWVVVSRTAGYELPCVRVYWNAAEAERSAQSERDEHADDVAWEAKKVARGKKGDIIPAKVVTVVPVTGVQAAEVAHIMGEIDFHSQDEADQETCSLWSERLAKMFA